MKLIVGMIVFLVFLVVCLQNYAPTRVAVLIWQTPEIPLIVVLLMSFLAGFLVGWIAPMLGARKKKPQALP